MATGTVGATVGTLVLIVTIGVDIATDADPYRRRTLRLTETGR